MKLKYLPHFILIGFSLATAASAMTLNNARIVSSKTWTTGNVKEGHFEDHSASSGSSPNGAWVDASVNDAEGYAKSNTYVYGQHGISINNSTRSKQMYLFEYKLCADQTSCLYRSDHVEVYPGGQVANSASSTLVTYFDAVGNYRATASTSVDGESRASKEKSATIYIRKR